MSRIDPWVFATALVVSLGASLVAGMLYRMFYDRRGTGSQIHRAFPLLGMSITTLFIGVQVSLPLSLGLLGSLSIIRFRTPIKEPEEVGFIMLVIAASISCATFNFLFLAILYCLAILVLAVLKGKWLLRRETHDGILIAVLPESELPLAGKALDFLREKTRRSTLDSSSSRDGKVSVQYSFVGLRCPVSDIHLNVQQITNATSVNVFLNRPGGVL